MEGGRRGAKGAAVKETELAVHSEDTSINRDRTESIRDPLLSGKEVSLKIS
jgi:hypothetical protein